MGGGGGGGGGILANGGKGVKLGFLSQARGRGWETAISRGFTLHW